MGYNITNIGRIGIAHQTTYGTATTSGFTAMECEASLPPVAREVFERNAITSGHYRLTPIEGSQHGQEYSLTFPIHGYSSSTVSSAPALLTVGAIAHPEAQILKAILGNAHTDSDSYIAAGTTVQASDNSLIQVQVGVDTDLSDNTAAGAAVAVPVTDASFTGLQTRAAFITSITDTDPDTYNLLQPLGGTTAAGANVYGAKTIFLDTTITPQFFTLEWRSLDNDSRVLLDSCNVKSVEMTLDPRGVAMMTATFIVNGITADDDTALTTTAYTLPVLPTCIGNNSARFLKGSVETAVNNLSITIEAQYAPRLSHNVSNGVAGLLCTGRSVEMKFSELLTAAPATTLTTAPDPAFFQLGNTAGNIMAVCMPAPVMYEVGALADAENTVTQEVTYRAGSYTADTATSGASPDPADSDFRIAFL